MLVLYHSPHSRSTTAHWMLNEIGEPFELRPIDLQNGEQKSPEFLAINPMGKLPTLTDDGVVVTEAAAVVAYLADRYPKAKLAPAFDAPERATYLRWMFFAASCIEPAVMDNYLKRETPPASAGWGSLDAVVQTLAGAIGPDRFVLGDTFSAADVYIGSTLRYLLQFNLMPKRPEFTGYVERLKQRPAWQKTLAADQGVAPRA